MAQGVVELPRSVGGDVGRAELPVLLKGSVSLVMTRFGGLVRRQLFAGREHRAFVCG